MSTIVGIDRPWHVARQARRAQSQTFKFANRVQASEGDEAFQPDGRLPAMHEQTFVVVDRPVFLTYEDRMSHDSDEKQLGLARLGSPSALAHENPGYILVEAPATCRGINTTAISHRHFPYECVTLTSGTARIPYRQNPENTVGSRSSASSRKRI